MTAAPGETQELLLTLPPPIPAPVVATSSRDRRRRRIIIGTTVALVIAGTIATGLALGLQSKESRVVDPVVGEVVLRGMP